MKNYQIIFGILLNLATFALRGEVFSLEPITAHGTDGFGEHALLYNPATYFPKKVEFQLLGGQSSHKTEYVAKSAFNTTDQDTKSKDNYVGFGAGIELGAGLALVFAHQQVKRSDASVLDDRTNNPVNETYSRFNHSVKLALKASDAFAIGLQLRLIQDKTDIYGNFFVSRSSNTTWKTSLFGTGAGVAGSFDQIRFGAAYLLPLKGKAEILGEEKIIVFPGIAEFTIAGTVGPTFRAGAAYRRWLYKRDDRPFGTTLNDSNQTKIDLFGLNFQHEHLFPLDQRQVGVDYMLNKDSFFGVSVARTFDEINFATTTTLPGENKKLNKMSVLEGSLHFRYRFTHFDLLAHVRSMQGKSHSDESGVERTITRNGSDLVLGLASTL